MSAENLIVDSLKVAVPVLASNHKTIIEKIKSGYKKIRTPSGSIDVSIYLTMFADFKPDYPLESVNEHVCQILMKFQEVESDCTYKYGQTEFAIIRQFNYADYFYFENEIIENSLEDDVDIMMPLVNGISVYCFPNGENIKSQLSDGYNLTQYMQEELMKKYDVKLMRSFVYVEFTKDEDFTKIKHALYKKQDEKQVKNLSGKKNELKLRMDATTPKILSEVL